MFITWLNIVALLVPKGKRNREYKVNLNEELYYVYSTKITLSPPSRGRGLKQFEIWTLTFEPVLSGYKSNKDSWL